MPTLAKYVYVAQKINNSELANVHIYITVHQLPVLRACSALFQPRQNALQTTTKQTYIMIINLQIFALVI